MYYFNKLVYILFCLPLLLIGGEEAKPYVLVSVGPHKYFVERIASGTVNVGLMVPPGVSSHTFEPTPKQVLQASKADIWFQVGESFEKKAGPSLKSFNKKLDIVDLRNGLDLIVYDENSQHQCVHHDCCDPHIWLSPKMAKIQAKTIADTLSNRYPNNQKIYERNLEFFLKELDQLDQDLEKKFTVMKNRTIMVSHPAYAYLARDYGFEQLSLECEGKDPTPQKLTAIVDEARRRGIKTIFIQEQLSTKGAKLVADLLNTKVVILDPYNENYPKNMMDIANAFSSEDKE